MGERVEVSALFFLESGIDLSDLHLLAPSLHSTLLLHSESIEVPIVPSRLRFFVVYANLSDLIGSHQFHTPISSTVVSTCIFVLLRLPSFVLSKIDPIDEPQQLALFLGKYHLFL